MKKFKTLISFIRWAMPQGGCSLRFFTSLVMLFLYGRESIYTHFKTLKPTSLKDFLNKLALIKVPSSDAELVTVQSRLLTRLLRTVYLTEVLSKNGGIDLVDPKHGYTAHPHFSYGESLGLTIHSVTENGSLD